MENKIAVIGYGYVGKAITNMFKDHYEVRIKDINDYIVYSENAQGTFSTDTNQYSQEAMWESINACSLSIVAVPTPMKKNKSCDTSIVEEVVSKLLTPVILIKSTIPPGTVDRLKKKYGKRIVFSPEYSGESSYWTPYKFHRDMKECPFVVLGGAPRDRQYVLDLIVPILGPKKRYFQCDAKEAELVKYFENIYFATKVTFANEMKSICDAFDVDYYTVREAWALDPRIDPMHTMVFEERGFGGKCLPKDANAIVKASEAVGYEPKLIKEVLASNERFRDMNSPIDSSSNHLKNIKYVNN